MDENADLRLTIETARKNKNWARRCYAYELAMEYFSLLEPDCYELCSYCDSIPEFLDEENECCLIRALGAVKVFVNRCVDAPSIARAVTRAVIDKLFFSASTRVREIATDIILDFVEWEACNAVLKELIAGALKYDGVRSDECIRVMRYALLDFGPHVISIYKLIDFVAVLVRNKSFLSINDECSQLLIVIYKCLGPQVRVHLTQILDPNYISAIEDSYEEMRNIPIYHCRFVRYSKDNSSSLRESDEEMFAACKIAEPTSHPSPVPTNYENEDMFIEGEGMLEADQSRLRDVGREPYCRGGDAGPLANGNKCYWSHQRFENLANYEMDYGAVGANQPQGNQVRLNGYGDAAYDEFENLDRADSVPELFRHVPDVALEPEQQVYQWSPNNVDQSHDHILPIAAEDKAIQTGRPSLQSFNPFEVIIQKLMHKYGTDNILNWLWSKLNSNLKQSLNEEETKESRKNHLSRNCKSLEDFGTIKDLIHNDTRSSVSNTSGRLWFPHRLTTSNYLNHSNERLFIPKSVIKMNDEENINGYKTIPWTEKQSTRGLHVLEKENENMKAVPVISTESIVFRHEFFQTGTIEETKENISGLVKSKSQKCHIKSSLVRRFFKKITFLFLNNKKTDGLENRNKNSKKFEYVFKRKRNPQSLNIQTLFHSYLNTNQQIYYVRQEPPMNHPPETENSCSYFNNHTNNCRNTYSINRCNLPSHCTDFHDGWPTHLNQNQNPAGFHSNPEELRNVVRSEDPQSPSNIAKENSDEEIMYLSASESISEISPNLCCYCFQKNSIRRLTSNRGEPNTDKKTCKKGLERGDIPGRPGSGGGKLVQERRDENSSFRLTTGRNTFGTISLRHRGSGDELSQPALNSQPAVEERRQEEESRGGRKGHKLFCCIPMGDPDEQAFQFGS